MRRLPFLVCERVCSGYCTTTESVVVEVRDGDTVSVPVTTTETPFDPVVVVPVLLPPPSVRRGEYENKPVLAWGVRVWEADPPAETTGLEWFLLTLEPVETLAPLPRRSKVRRTAAPMAWRGTPGQGEAPALQGKRPSPRDPQRRPEEKARSVPAGTTP